MMQKIQHTHVQILLIKKLIKPDEGDDLQSISSTVCSSWITLQVMLCNWCWYHVMN